MPPESRRKLTEEERAAMGAAMQDPETGQWRVERRQEAREVWMAARAFYRAEGNTDREGLIEFFSAQLDQQSEEDEDA